MFHCRKCERHIVVCMHLSDWPSCYSKTRCNFTADMLSGVISVLYCESKPAGNDSRNRMCCSCVTLESLTLALCPAINWSSSVWTLVRLRAS